MNLWKCHVCTIVNTKVRNYSYLHRAYILVLFRERDFLTKLKPSLLKYNLIEKISNRIISKRKAS
jgi:hypothetical protein